MLNKILLAVNVIAFLLIVRAAFRLANRDKPKFYSIGTTIKYWTGSLNHGDKFVIFPLKDKAIDESDRFLQFKVHKTSNKKSVDLVYPLKFKNSKAQSDEKDMISLSDFHKVKREVYLDEENDLKFYFFEINPDLPKNILFLTSLAILQRGFGLGTEVGIRTIPKDPSSSNQRYFP